MPRLDVQKLIKAAGDEGKPMQLAILQAVGDSMFAANLGRMVREQMEHLANGIEVAHHDITKLKLHTCPGCDASRSVAPCAINDIDSKRYKPDDQLVALLDSIKSADIALFVVTTRAGGLNTVAQNLLERMDCAERRAKGRVLFKHKLAGVVVASNQPVVWTVADRLVGTLNCMGFTIPGTSILAVSSAGHPDEQSEETSDEHSDDDVTTDAHSDLLDTREMRDHVRKVADALVSTAKALA
jgi:multimeric flavodoxin WrbA